MARKRRPHASRYKPAWWLPGGHAQTLWGRFGKRAVGPRTRVETLRAPDGEMLHVHSIGEDAHAPRILLLHGLEGSHESHYVGRLLQGASDRQWGADLLVFRGCGSAPNVAPRFYHSGETSDVAFVFSALRAKWPDVTWCIAGVSLGGNVLLKWLGERGEAVDKTIRGAAAVSVPFDLEAGARHIARGFARIYDWNFLRSLRAKALMKLNGQPGLFAEERLRAAKSIFDFDDAVTAPVHGFASAIDYYTRSSSLQFLSRIRVPTLLLSAEDDPFLPTRVLNRVRSAADANSALTVEFQRRGGHVGFVSGVWPWRPHYYAEERVLDFFDSLMQ